MNEPKVNKNFIDDTKIPIEEKEKVIKRKKVLFTITSWIVTLCIVIPLLGFGSYKFYVSYIRNVTIPIIKQTPTPSPTKSGANSEPIVSNEYSSDNLRVNITYLSDAKVTDSPEVNGQSRTLVVLYTKDDTSKDTWTEDNLANGYIFKVTTFDTQIRDLDEIVNVKLASYTANCAATAVFSKITDTTVNFEPAKTFTIQNCNGDYVITYVSKFNTNYEITRIFRGDVGYRQLYQSNANDIYNSLTFYPEGGPVGPTETYTNTDYGFAFVHPHLDSACCNVPAPTLKNPEKIISLGNKYTYVDKNNFDGIGFYAFRLNDQYNFQQYVTNNRKALTDDYMVVRGVPPKAQDTEMKIGGKNAILLHGYSWQGNDLIFVDVEKDFGKSYALIISIKNTSGDAFQKTIDDLLKSFKFN